MHRSGQIFHFTTISSDILYTAETTQCFWIGIWHSSKEPKSDVFSSFSLFAQLPQSVDWILKSSAMVLRRSTDSTCSESANSAWLFRRQKAYHRLKFCQYPDSDKFWLWNRPVSVSACTLCRLSTVPKTEDRMSTSPTRTDIYDFLTYTYCSSPGKMFVLSLYRSSCCGFKSTNT